MSTLAHIADRVLNRPLLIMPEKAAVITEVLSGRLGIEPLPVPDGNRFEPAKGRVFSPDGEPDGLGVTANGVGIIPVVGSLVNRGAWIGANSGLVSYEGVQALVKRAMADDEVKAVLLDIESPGGEAVGAFETAALVRRLAAAKPTVAVVNGMAASAAYGIASGAGEVVTVETGISGSIGVVMLHADFSRQLANDGITPTLIFAGAHKVDGNPFEPLPESVRDDWQAEVDGFYRHFLGTVAAGRGARLSAEAAAATEARIFVGEQAVAAGLADRVGTFETVLDELSRGQGRTHSPQRSASMSEKPGTSAAEQNAGITQAQHDEAVKAARQAGHNDGLEAGRAETEQAVSAALSAERERVSGIDALTGKVPAKMLAEARADGEATAETVARKFLESEQFGKSSALAAIAGDEEQARAATPAPSAGPQGTPAPSTDEEFKAAWENDPQLQREFSHWKNYAAVTRRNARKGAAA